MMNTIKNSARTPTNIPINRLGFSANNVPISGIVFSSSSTKYYVQISHNVTIDAMMPTTVWQAAISLSLLQQTPRFLTMTAPQHMHMGAPVGALKHTRYENIFVPQGNVADRTFAGAGTAKAVGAAPDVHKTIPAAGKGGKGLGLDQFALVKPGGTDRTHLGIAGDANALAGTFAPGPGLPAQADSRQLAD
jgi:hypothetical protein